MINKQNLWFVTLFSLILVLGIYYVTLGDETLQLETITNNSEPVINIEETDSLVALRVADDEETLKEIAIYETILLDTAATLEEKNDAYDSLQVINDIKSKKNELEKIIKEKFSLDSFVKINGDQINITISGSNHDATLANNIIRAVQESYDSQMYITIKFQAT